MARKPRERLALEEAKALCSEPALRKLAGSRATYSNWNARGVPWEVVGPLILEQLSQASVAHSQFASHGGPDMHAVLDAQGRVFQLARHYGVDSKEFQAVHQLLTLYMPDTLRNGKPQGAPLAPLHSVAAPAHIGRAPRKSGTSASRAPRKNSR